MARRCSLSFHYQDAIDFRANVVRSHNDTKDDNSGLFDASIYEIAKRQGDIALKQLINGGLEKHVGHRRSDWLWDLRAAMGPIRAHGEH